MSANVGHNSLRAEVVTSMEQLVQVFALRSLGYMEETVMPFDHAYDGNDLQATHFIAYDHAEPVGTMRVRWFKDFAKVAKEPARYHNEDYYELVRYLDVSPDAIGPETDARVLYRVEGKWDEP